MSGQPPNGARAEPKHRKLLSARSISTSQLARLQQQDGAGHRLPSSSSSSLTTSSSSPFSNGISIGSRIASSSPVKLRLLGRSSTTSNVDKRKDSQKSATAATPLDGTSRTEVTASNGFSGRNTGSTDDQRATELFVQHALYPPASSASATPSPLSSPNPSPQPECGSRTLLRQPPRSRSSHTLRAGFSGHASDGEHRQSKTPNSASRSDRVPISPFFGRKSSHEQSDMSGSSVPPTPAPPEQPAVGLGASSQSAGGSTYSSSIPTSYSVSALADSGNASRDTLETSRFRIATKEGASRSRTTSRSDTGDAASSMEHLASSRSRDAASKSGPSASTSFGNLAKGSHSASHRNRDSNPTMPDRDAGTDATTSDSNSAPPTRRKKETLLGSSSRSVPKASLSASVAGVNPYVSRGEMKQPIMPSADVAASIEAGTSVPWSIGTPYWSTAPIWGKPPSRPLRAHSASLVEMPSALAAARRLPALSSQLASVRTELQLPPMASLWVFGGCDTKDCSRDTWVLDLESYAWRKPKLSSWQGRPDHHPPPLRAHSATFIPPFQSLGSSHPEKALSASTDGHLLLFGGGDGPSYLNDIYVLSLRTQTWCKPALLDKVTGHIPPQRRAHAAIYYEPKKWLIVFGGGNGSRALNDTWVLECKNWNEKGLNWRKVDTKGPKPAVRGYHTMNLVGDMAVVFGGSNGSDCFSDVFVLDLRTFTWQEVGIFAPSLHCTRLSHTCTVLSPTTLLILGGHGGTGYASELVVLHLTFSSSSSSVSGRFEKIEHAGVPPSKRGYHSATLYDGRVVLIGGFDGKTTFDDTWTLDVGAWTELASMEV